MPGSVRSILFARIDQLPGEARGLLQTAAVIGRRFDPQLILALTGARKNAAASFATLEAADLIHRDEASGDYLFKHVLFRDAIYERILSGPLVATHLKVAEELERRSGNALFENAEALALHFSEGNNPAKAFKYLSLAAQKSLNVYAVAEAEAYFRKALAAYEQNPSCAEPLPATRAVVGLLETLMLKSDYREAGNIADKLMPVVKQAGETPELVAAYYYRTLSLVQQYELRRALDLMTEAREIAERIGEARARAYVEVGLLHCRTRLGLDTADEAERRRSEVMTDCLKFDDNFLRNAAYFCVIWDYFYRGLIKDARHVATQLIASGEASGDPRAIGFANWILGWISVIGGFPEAAIAHADECLRVAIAPFDRLQGEIIRAVAAILSGSSDGLAQIEMLNAEFERLGALYNVMEGPRGLALIENGRIREGIGLLERAIVAREAAGDRTSAGFVRILLAEVYIQILAGGRKTPLAIILKNLPALAAAKLRGAGRARTLLDAAGSHEQFSEGGAVIARINLDRGQLLAMRGRRAEARGCLERARAVFDAQGLDGLRRKSEQAMAKLA